MDLKDRIKKELARELAAVNFNEGQKAQLAKILLECQVKQKRSPLLSFLKRLWHGSTEIPISWGLV